MRVIVRGKHVDIDPYVLRTQLHMTRAEFSAAYGIPRKTIRDWEQGLYKPKDIAQSYLNRIAYFPAELRRSSLAKRSRVIK